MTPEEKRHRDATWMQLYNANHPQTPQPITEADVEQIRNERSLDIAPVEISMHTARRLVGLIDKARGYVTTGALARELDDVRRVLTANMAHTEREHNERITPHD